MTSKHRKEFETKLLKHMPHANLDFDGEGYTSALVQVAWTGWNFSVQSLREQSQIQEALQARVQELVVALELIANAETYDLDLAYCQRISSGVIAKTKGDS